MKPQVSERGGALGTILAIIAGLVIACVVVALVTLWFISRYARIDIRDTARGTRVEIDTPFGGLKVRTAEDIAAELKLPVYPGAWATEKSASVELWGGVGEQEEGLDLAVAQFRTPDSLKEVDTWYREQLGPEFSRKTGREAERWERGRTRRWPRHIHIAAEGVVYLQEDGGRVRGVALKPKVREVELTLFDIWEVQGQ